MLVKQLPYKRQWSTIPATLFGNLRQARHRVGYSWIMYSNQQTTVADPVAAPSRIKTHLSLVAVDIMGVKFIANSVASSSEQCGADRAVFGSGVN